MLIPRRYAELGQFRNEWLWAHYHFSFSGYHDPAFTRHGALRVINDDIVQPRQGFGRHGHDNMEIITYVRQGAISHADSLGNQGRTAAGEVQVMSAGSGIQHAEQNAESEATRLYQIWILPHTRDVAPRWEQRAFPTDAAERLPLLVSGLPEHADSGALFIHAHAALYGGRLSAGAQCTQPLGARAYLLVSEGTVEAGGIALEKGDGMMIAEEPSLCLRSATGAELLLIDLP